ncbi:MAG TPA: carbohydrate kinase family protein [Candidatus Nanoarchaeia archaeon]|nr:carbohydrate kinase family protein [Candidatus Nanoarchaeia archaeon]
MSANVREILSFLSKPAKRFNVVVMPDYFMDRLINLTVDPQAFCSTVSSIVQRKGGSVDQVVQVDQRGGNAINVASALLALGVTVTPIICTSALGLEQVRFFFKKHNVDFSHIKTFSEASMTTALEFGSEDGKANVMLRNLGSLSNFGPDDLTEADYEAVDKADYVCLFNWAGTKKHGTSLIESAFRRAKKGRCKTYLDTADPLPNKAKIPELMEKVLTSNQVDVLSMNENEAVTYASQLSNKVEESRSKVEFNELALLSAQILAKHLHARIDLHTTTFASTVTKERAFLAPAFKVAALRATGAGDAWDAGNLLGEAGGLSPEARLGLANAVAACYLSDKDGVHPDRQSLIRFLEKMK